MEDVREALMTSAGVGVPSQDLGILRPAGV